jgi:hypothetical protein
MEIIERPQQGINKALSEYAPGRLIVINKETYRSGGVVANVLPTEANRAAPLFADVQELVHCDSCSFVRDLANGDRAQTACPVCAGNLQRTRMIVPQVFVPEGGRPLAEDDREQEITYATGAQFPVPVGNDDVPGLQPAGVRLAYTVATDRQLVTANKGQVVNEASQGFWVCDHCGSTHSETPAAAPHERPYRIEFTFNQPRPPNLCSGTFHNVFLGHIFKTDLLLLRVTLVPRWRSARTIALYCTRSRTPSIRSPKPCGWPRAAILSSILTSRSSDRVSGLSPRVIVNSFI